MQNAIVNLTDKVLGRNPVSTGRTRPVTSGTESMHALTWHGAGDMRYQTIGKPVISEPSDVLIQVTATAICGSDLHIYTGNLPGLKGGDVVGHEFMGIVVDKGNAVLLPLGTRVVVSCAIACGKCSHCQKGQFSGCDTTNSSRLAEETYGHAGAGVFGLGHLLGDYNGGQAEYVRVPFGDVNCLPIPPELSDEKALFLSDIVATSYHACRLVKEGDTVGIWGMGPVGLLAARWCQILGASRIIGISGTKYRLDLAQDKLGIETLNYHDVNVLDELAKMVPEGLDSTIDATAYRFAKGTAHRVQRALGLESDTPEVITECLTAVKKFGNLCIIGSYVGIANAFPIGFLFIKHLTIAAGVVPVQRLWKYCLEKILDGTFDPTFIITHRLSLKDGPAAYKMMNDHDDFYVKGILRPESSESFVNEASEKVVVTEGEFHVSSRVLH